MTELETARNEINLIDREMALLFERRMNASAAIGRYKKSRGLAVRDPEREKTLIEKNVSYISDPTLIPCYLEFLRKVVDLSCKLQESLSEEK